MSLSDVGQWSTAFQDSQESMGGVVNRIAVAHRPRNRRSANSAPQGRKSEAATSRTTMHCSATP